MKIGFGEANITPRGGKIAIAGRIPVRLTDQIHDEVKAVAMIAGSGSARTVWVSCDICHPTCALTEDVAALLDDVLPEFHKDQLIISATHTTACCRLANDYLTLSELPSSDNVLSLLDARAQVCDGIVKAVKTAYENSEECVASYACADILTGLCRRVVYRDGSAIMYGRTDREDFFGMEYPDGGPTKVLYFRSVSTDALKGIFVSAPCPAQADETSPYITADYWGITREHVKKALGSTVVVMGVCASAGELAPKRLMNTYCCPVQGRERALELGLLIGDAVIEKSSCPIRVYEPRELIYARISKELDFPVRQTTEAAYVAAQCYFADADNFHEDGSPRKWFEFNQNKYIIKLWQAKETVHTAQISAIRMGDVLFYTAPVELYTAYSKQINNLFPGNPVLDVQLSNDNLGYLPTQEAIEHGGYSTFLFNTRTGPEGGELFVDTVRTMLNDLLLEDK